MQIFQLLRSRIYMEGGGWKPPFYGLRGGGSGAGEGGAGYGQLSLIESYPVGGVISRGGVDVDGHSCNIVVRSLWTLSISVYPETGNPLSNTSVLKLIRFPLQSNLPMFATRS